MTTISVNYNFSSFRVKITPNTVMNDILSESLSYFKLADDDAPIGQTEWILEHNKKPITLDLPWRFLNLSPGVNLELKKCGTSSTSDKVTSVRIKLQVPGHPTVIETIKSSADLKDMLDILASKHGWSISLPDSKLQVFSKTIPYPQLRGLNLSDVGVKDSVLLRLVSPASGQSVQEKPVDKPPITEDEVDDKTAASEQQVLVAKKHEKHQVSAFVPPETSIATQLRNEVEEEEDFEMTVEQARAYQKMLSKQTGNLGGPLLSKRLREARENAQKPVVTECVVRIRFPDLNHIEIAFHPDENMNTVYQIVSESVLSEHLDFELSQPHPYIVYPRDSRKLVDDLAFGSKTLLLFNSQNKSPYLKNTILKNAKELGEADDVRLDRMVQIKDAPTEQVSLKTSVNSKMSIQASKIDKVPKWLKLSKK